MSSYECNIIEYLIDIHQHILPFLDDGPMLVDEALLLAEKAYEEGVRTIIATPHCCNGIHHFSPYEITDACSMFSSVLDKNMIKIDIRPGAEIRLEHDTVKKFDRGELMTLNDSGRYILIELPQTFLVDGVIMILSQLRERDVIPVIAHPERNRLLITKPDIVERLKDGGALMQLTTSSLTGDFGKPVMKFSETLVKEGVVSFIASDIHPGRHYRIKEAVSRLIKLAGKSAAYSIIHEESEKLLSFPQRNSAFFQVHA